MKLKIAIALTAALAFTILLGAQNIKPPDAWMAKYQQYLVKSRQLSSANAKAAPELAAIKKKYGIDVLQAETTKLATDLNAEMNEAGKAFDESTMEWVTKTSTPSK